MKPKYSVTIHGAQKSILYDGHSVAAYTRSLLVARRTLKAVRASGVIHAIAAGTLDTYTFVDGVQQPRIGSTWEGLAEADDPIYNEGWQIHLPGKGGAE